jgi:PPOX class probable FMN-dependent enzyme
MRLLGEEYSPIGQRKSMASGRVPGLSPGPAPPEVTRMSIIRSIAELEARYGGPGAVAPASTAKVADHVTPEYRRFIEAAPFLALATVGPEGLDCTPRGDRPGFVRVADPRRLLLPDRRGNNRVDSLRNIVRDPRVGLLFLIPGIGNTMRVNGRAVLETAPALLDSFAVGGQAPRCVLVVTVEEVYFQCARALIRSGLWQAESHVDPATLPTPGQILAAMSQGEVGGEAYDRSWAARARQSLW